MWTLGTCPYKSLGKLSFKGRDDQEIRTASLLPFVKHDVCKINHQRRDSACLFTLKAETAFFHLEKLSYDGMVNVDNEDEREF